jgi:hypothetical protein
MWMELEVRMRRGRPRRGRRRRRLGEEGSRRGAVAVKRGSAEMATRER